MEHLHDELTNAFGLFGRAAVVTGAASGIGRQAAITFAQAGADVMILDVSESGLQETAALVEALDRRCIARRTDVSTRSEVDAAADAALAEFGRLDVWANVAGILRYSLITEADEAHVRSVVDVNLLGVYWGVAAAARVMSAAGRGAIVNIASAGGDIGAPTLSVYGMTKAAVMHLTKTAAVELGPKGIRVNAIAPGWIDTPMVSHYYTDKDGRVDDKARAEALSTRAAASIIGRTGEPTDISYAMLYAVSDAARFMTGQTLRPNGGAFMA